MPTIHVEWSASRPPEAYAQVARVIADAVHSIASAAVASPGEVLVYFDDLPAGELYVDGHQIARAEEQ